MIAALQIWLAPVAGAFLTLWAAAIGLAAGGNADLARKLAARLPGDGDAPSTARSLHVVHLALLLTAGAMAASALGWWSYGSTEGLPRFLLAIFLVWLVGDLLPRALAVLSPELVEVGTAIAGASLGLFRPLLRLVAWADRAGRGRPAETDEDGSVAGREMMSGVFGLREMTVAEVMTPRIDIIAVDLADSRAEVLEAFRQSEHSRLLVLDRTPDAVTGVLHAKEFLSGLEAGGDWHDLIRPAAFVPETKTLSSQLRDFQRGPSSHLSVVVDEFGGTAGLVTLEDVLEQVVGEIRDEYDTDEVLPIQAQPGGRWVVQGGVALAELEAELDHSFEREDVDTVGGLVLAELGRVPRVGESITLGPWRFTVDQLVRRRVRRVVVEAATPVTVGEDP